MTGAAQFDFWVDRVEEISLHILDVVENSLSAGAKLVEIGLEKDLNRDRLVLEIADDGPGMSKENTGMAADPFYTTRTTRRVGLGLSLLRQAAEQTGGTFHLASDPGRGVRLKVEFGLSHWDRAPLGDMAGTLMSLIVGWPAVDYVYRQKCGENEFEVDTREIRRILDDVPLSDPAVMDFLRRSIREGLSELGAV